MIDHSQSGEFQSPGGFVFGVQGWNWGEPRPTSITFFLDGTARVSDQHGRPIRGTTVDNKEVLFAPTSPKNDDAPGARSRYATHVEVIDALTKELVDWQKLTCAGWPQLPYSELKELPELPPTPLDELRKIRNPELRRDALRIRREANEVMTRELAAIEDE